MKFTPDDYTTKKLLLGWLSHALIGAAIAFVCLVVSFADLHAIGYPSAIYTFREGEQYRSRRRKGKPTVWSKVIIDVLVAILGAVIVVMVF